MEPSSSFRDEGLELRILPHASSRGHCAVQREQSEPVVVRVCVVPKAPSVHTHMRLVPRLEAVPERLQQRSDNHILQPRLWGGGAHQAQTGAAPGPPPCCASGLPPGPVTGWWADPARGLRICPTGPGSSSLSFGPCPTVPSCPGSREVDALAGHHTGGGQWLGSGA